MLVRSDTHVEQLDLLRGLAIVLMIVNHAGVRLLDPKLQSAGPLAALVFLGSFAPVLFYLTTGFGVGIGKHSVDLAGFRSALLKAGLLAVADQFLFWKNGEPWGMDFLGFIAFSTVLVTAIRASISPVAVCVALIGSVITLRFGFGPWLARHYQLPGVVVWLVGVEEIDNVIYPFSPWIVYPLLGFVLARGYQGIASSFATLLWSRLDAVAIGALVLAAVLHGAHAIFFRWGTMSFAFFVLSLGVASVCVLAVWWMAVRWPLVSRLLSLRGITSLAAVPIHYALIELFAAWGVAQRGGVPAVALIAALIASSVVLSRAFASGVRRWISESTHAGAWYVLGTVVALCGAVSWLQPRQPHVVFAAFVGGQLAIAALLAARDRPRASVAATDALQIQRPCCS